MTRNCEVCGKPFEATRARICGPRCRKRKSRGISVFPTSPVSSRSNSVTSGDQSATPVVTSIDPDSISPLSEDQESFIKSVRDELEAAGVLNTMTGRHVVMLARQMCGSETAGGMTSLSKEFSRVRAEALRNAAPLTADPLDELQARREAKLAAV